MFENSFLELTGDLSWNPSYVSKEELFPSEQAGLFKDPKLWQDWSEPFKTTYDEYVRNQHAKTQSIESLRKALANSKTYNRIPPSWLSALKLYAAAFSLAEFAAVVGNLRA